jgi:ABC-type polysaccharide/polyol phosphate export permease
MTSYLVAVWRCRYFWLSLVRMDLQNRYRRSILGLGWSLVHPIAMTAILCVVFAQVFHAELHEFVPRLLAGLAFWQYLSSVTTQGCGCFLQAEPYIRQWPSPLAVFPLRVTLGNAVHFLPALGAALGLTIVLNGVPDLRAMLSLVPTLLLLVLLGWALALLAGTANVLFRDTEHIMPIALQLLFYATPILYKPSDLGAGPMTYWIGWNPLTPFVDLIRVPLVQQTVPDLSTYLAASVFVLVLLLMASLVLRHLQRKLIFFL